MESGIAVVAEDDEVKMDEMCFWVDSDAMFNVATGCLRYSKNDFFL